MITSKQDYIYYLESDKKSLNITRSRPIFYADEIWKFQRLLRKTEYYMNCKKGFLNKIIKNFLRFRLHKQRVKLGVEIFPNTFGPGMAIAHAGQIVNIHSKIGRNCRMHAGVNIGTSAGFSDQAPTLGDNIYIGPGAKIYGKITIGNNVSIGANAVVTKSFGDNVTIAGVPADIISNKGSKGILTEGAIY